MHVYTQQTLSQPTACRQTPDTTESTSLSGCWRWTKTFFKRSIPRQSVPMMTTNGMHSLT
jgi:hypothetical protein